MTKLNDADHARRLAETATTEELRQEFLRIAAELQREEWRERAGRERDTAASSGNTRGVQCLPSD